MYRKLLKIFLAAFLLNWIWETLQIPLYAPYQPGPIFHTQTQWILAATFSDATFIAVLAVFFLKISHPQKRLWYAFMIGVIAAILVETYALQTGQWAYSELMPIVPLFNTGLTPTIQLGALAYLIFRLSG